MKIKNVIFDLDGTLLDTTEGVLESVKYTIRTLKYRELPHDELLTFIGPPIQNSFASHYGCDIENAQKAAEIFRDYYKNKALLLAKPYDGIYELCEGLQKEGIRMAVATYKREDYALTLLRHFHFDTYCNPMHGADHKNKLKKEDIVLMCQTEMRGTKENSVLIGDTIHDARGALEAQIPFIAVTYGFGFKSTNDCDDYPHIGVASSPLDVLRLIDEIQ